MDFGEKETNIMSMKIETGTATNTGMVRTHNEDSLICMDLSIAGGMERSYPDLYAVADGLGGHQSGEIASDLALRVLAKTILNSIIMPSLENTPTVLTAEAISPYLADAVKAANSEVYNQGRDSGMGTTLVAAVLIGHSACIANVGDSRVYLMEDNKLRQVSRDHSLVADMAEEGKIQPDDIYTHPSRNIVTRCIGTGPAVKVDLFTEELNPGNSLVLCSDGLWEMIRDDQIRDILLGAASPQDACDLLVQQANKNGGVDNITVIILQSK